MTKCWQGSKNFNQKKADLDTDLDLDPDLDLDLDPDLDLDLDLDPDTMEGQCLDLMGWTTHIKYYL